MITSGLGLGWDWDGTGKRLGWDCGELWAGSLGTHCSPAPLRAPGLQPLTLSTGRREKKRRRF